MSRRTSSIVVDLNKNIEKATGLRSGSVRLEHDSYNYNNNARGLSSKMKRRQDQGILRGAAHFVLKRVRGLTQRGTSSRGGKKRTLRKKANKRKTKKRGIKREN